MLYCEVLYCIVLYCIVLYCIVLYCIVLYIIVSYHILIIVYRQICDFLLSFVAFFRHDLVSHPFWGENADGNEAPSNLPPQPAFEAYLR